MYKILKEFRNICKTTVGKYLYILRVKAALWLSLKTSVQNGLQLLSMKYNMLNKILSGVHQNCWKMDTLVTIGKQLGK